MSIEIEKAVLPTATLSPDAAKRALIAIGTLFFVNGAVFSNWLPRIPEVKDRLQMGNGGLGSTLLGTGLGGLIGSFAVAHVLHRFGTKRVVITAATILTCGIPLIAIAPSPIVLLTLLVWIGFCDVQADMAINSQAATIQEIVGRSVMQRLHGMWSLGFTIGAGMGWLASAARISIGVHLSIVAVVMLITVWVARPYLLVDERPAVSNDTGRMKILFTAPVLAMGVMAIAISWMEATPNDWSALAMRDVFHAGRFTGSGTVIFAGSMLIGRLFGDAVQDRIGAARLFDRAVSLVAFGALLVIVLPWAVSALIGFAVWGLGASVLFPQIYAMAARLPGTTAGAGLGAMSMGQRFGFLVGPLMVGNIAQVTQLKVAFSLVVGAAVIVALVARHLLASERSINVALR